MSKKEWERGQCLFVLAGKICYNTYMLIWERSTRGAGAEFGQEEAGGMIDQRYFKYIRTIAQYHSFSKAAQALYVSQPALSRFVKKGNKVAVTGSIQIRNYEDNSGQKRTFVDIVADDVEFLTPKGSGSGAEDDFIPAAPKKKPSLEAIDDDSDIPF